MQNERERERERGMKKSMPRNKEHYCQTIYGWLAK